MSTPVPTIAKVARDGTTTTIRMKLSNADPASVKARIENGELIVTARTGPPATSPTGATERHRLIDLGPKLRPLATA